MRAIVRLLILAVLGCALLSCSREKADSLVRDVSEEAAPLEEELLGEWVAGEIWFAEPPPHVQQSIKTISFGTEKIVEWSYVFEGEMRQGRGRYVLLARSSGEGVGRGLPVLFVAPEHYRDPALSSVCLLEIRDVEIDFDARFPVESVGKVLKGRTASEGPLLFVRKAKNVGSDPADRR